MDRVLLRTTYFTSVSLEKTVTFATLGEIFFNNYNIIYKYTVYILLDVLNDVNDEYRVYSTVSKISTFHMLIFTNVELGPNSSH